MIMCRLAAHVHHTRCTSQLPPSNHGLVDQALMADYVALHVLCIHHPFKVSSHLSSPIVLVLHVTVCVLLGVEFF